MNPCEFSMAVSAVANAIASRLSDDDLALASTALTQLADTLSTIYTMRVRHGIIDENASSPSAGLPEYDG